MEDNREPLIDLKGREEIKIRWFHVHEKFWAELAPLRNLRPWLESSTFAKFAALAGGENAPAPKPPMPRQPLRLFEILVRYANELYEGEFVYYPGSPEIDIWISVLASNIEQMVIDNVETIGALTFHATIDEMREAIREGLRKYVTTLRKPIYFLPLPDSEPQSPAPTFQSSNPEVRSVKSIGERLDDAALLTGHKQVWSAIGISKSSYFEVKSGGGGKKAKKKVESYLFRLEQERKRNLD